MRPELTPKLRDWITEWADRNTKWFKDGDFSYPFVNKNRLMTLLSLITRTEEQEAENQIVIRKINEYWEDEGIYYDKKPDILDNIIFWLQLEEE